MGGFKMHKLRNRYAFGLGTIGRDMMYTIVSMYLIYYLTDVLDLTTSTIWWVTAVLFCARIFDAFNDPIMGVIVDNTHGKYGKFKPWIAIGALTSGLVTILLFADFGLTGAGFVIFFGIVYVMWDITFTANDIGYWSMLPSLSLDQKEREKIGATARICANIGLFFVVTAIVPITNALEASLGSMQKAYFVFTVIIVVVMWLGQSITLFGVKEVAKVGIEHQNTSLKEMFNVLYKNDQLMFTALSMSLFTIGYSVTTSFGIYFFKYAYGDENMYSAFALILGVSQLTALVIFPYISKVLNRNKFYLLSTVLVVLGYIVFFFASNTSMLFIGIAGILIFIGQAFIQLMMLMFLADTVEYGHWKLGKRNGSITFSLQPFINKMGSAIATGIVGAVVILSGIKDANSAADVTAEGLLMMKFAMLVFPLICILLGYIVYNKKYKIDEKFYGEIIKDLEARGELIEVDGGSVS